WAGGAWVGGSRVAWRLPDSAAVTGGEAPGRREVRRRGVAVTRFGGGNRQIRAQNHATYAAVG
ncbi:hypothetical protein, partial [Rothia koreensis]|uniref:hypothetical protein n=1 Tax=Rothia koreensis TaxID=592378 RepID=UPI001EE8A644